LLQQGRVVVLDYADTSASLARRPWLEWVRTYRAHERGGHPLDAPGSQDITCEVAVDQLGALVRPPDRDTSQADWLRAHGIDDLVADARATWRERAALGDLEALKARSRVGEADALTDPTGLGAFRVLEWDVG
jgi:SAM-dependent MidA family methyltransferase